MSAGWPGLLVARAREARRKRDITVRPFASCGSASLRHPDNKLSGATLIQIHAPSSRRRLALIPLAITGTLGHEAFGALRCFERACLRTSRSFHGSSEGPSSFDSGPTVTCHLLGGSKPKVCLRHRRRRQASVALRMCACRYKRHLLHCWSSLWFGTTKRVQESNQRVHLDGWPERGRNRQEDGRVFSRPHILNK